MTQLFYYEPTEHRCPECGAALTRVDKTNLLGCDEGHGPYFLV